MSKQTVDVVPTKKSVHIEIVAFTESHPVAFQAMLTLLFSLGVVPEPALFCKQRFLLFATRSWSCIVRVVDINSVSVGLTVCCGFGSPVCGATGGQHCSLSNRRPLSPGIARGFDSIGPGRVATLKDDPRHPMKFGI